MNTTGVQPLFGVFAADSSLAVGGLAPGVPSPFVAAAALNAGTYAFGEPSTYRVTVVDTLGRVRIRFGTEDLEPEAPDDAEVERRENRLREALRGVGRTPPPEFRQMFEQAVHQPRPFFTIMSFAADDYQRLWIATTRGAPDSTEFDIFSGTGELLGTAVIPHRVRALAMRERRCAMLVERRDHLYEGQHAVVIYQIFGGAAEP